MPNHVENDFIVTGSRKEIAEFKKFAQDGGELLSADKFIPYPQRFKDADADGSGKGFNSGGYEWCIENWGTKWGFYAVELVKESPTSLKYRFNTAWSPALPVIKRMGVLFFTLKFTLKYYERGMEFKGTYKVDKGVVVADTTGKYRGNRGG